MEETRHTPGYYYVSVTDGPRYRLLLGPFENDHAAALAMVKAVRLKAQELDAWAVFYGFGTCRLPIDTPNPPAGRLNDLFNMKSWQAHERGRS